MINDNEKQHYLDVKKIKWFVEEKDRSWWRMLSKLFKIVCE